MFYGLSNLRIYVLAMWNIVVVVVGVLLSDSLWGRIFSSVLLHIPTICALAFLWTCNSTRRTLASLEKPRALIPNGHHSDWGPPALFRARAFWSTKRIINYYWWLSWTVCVCCDVLVGGCNSVTSSGTQTLWGRFICFANHGGVAVAQVASVVEQEQNCSRQCFIYGNW